MTKNHWLKISLIVLVCGLFSFNSALAGSKKVGEVCTGKNSDCVSNKCDTTKNPAICVCSENSHCESGQYCTNAKQCESKAIPGALMADETSCTNQCISGQCSYLTSNQQYLCKCNNNNQCSAGQYCSSLGKCETQKKAGDVCTAKEQCPNKLQCDKKNTSDQNQVCLCTSNSECPDSNYFCSLSAGSADYKTCAQKKDLGATCIVGDNCKSKTCYIGKCICDENSDCPQGSAVCQTEKTQANFGECITKQPIGAECDPTKPNLCIGNLCSADTSSGKNLCKCDDNSQCATGNYCEKTGNQLCIPQVADDQPCPAGDEQCLSGKCDETSKICLKTEKPADSDSGNSVTVLGLPNLLETENPSVIAGRIISFIIGMVGTIALIMFCYGGFLWLISGGKEETIAKGKDTMIWAVIGLALVFASSLIVNQLMKILSGQ